MNISYVVIVFAGLVSIFVGVYAQWQGDKKEKEADKKVSEIQESLNQEALALANLLLMKENMSHSMRAVFSFQHPINKIFLVPDEKFRKKSAPSPSLHYSKYPSPEGAWNIYTFHKQPSPMGAAVMSANLGSLGSFTANIWSGFAGIASFVYTENSRQNVAYELSDKSGDSANLGKVYTELKRSTTNVTLLKYYPAGVSKEQVKEEENRFLAQDVAVSIECPILFDKGIWYKVDLVLPNADNPYEITTIESVEGLHLVVNYKWIVDKNNNGFMYNKVDASLYDPTAPYVPLQNIDDSSKTDSANDSPEEKDNH